jgi:hypothetical protein
MDRRAKVQGTNVLPREFAVGVGKRTPLERCAAFRPPEYHGMTSFYIDDFENEVRRCIQSWECQHLIAISGVTAEGNVKHFTGTVQAIHQHPTTGLWRVVIQEPTATNSSATENSYALAKSA